jgi:hypothetical protein
MQAGDHPAPEVQTGATIKHGHAVEPAIQVLPAGLEGEILNYLSTCQKDPQTIRRRESLDASTPHIIVYAEQVTAFFCVRVLLITEHSTGNVLTRLLQHTHPSIAELGEALRSLQAAFEVHGVNARRCATRKANIDSGNRVASAKLAS